MTAAAACEADLTLSIKAWIWRLRERCAAYKEVGLAGSTRGDSVLPVPILPGSLSFTSDLIALFDSLSIEAEDEGSALRTVGKNALQRSTACFIRPSSMLSLISGARQERCQDGQYCKLPT